jgi:transcriptional regulator NrdR family protein
MKCPLCGLVDNKGRVLDSRPVNNTIKRRRECSHCKGRWSTFEVLEWDYITERNKHRYMAWNDGEIATMVSMYQNGENKTAIAKKIGRSRHSVSRKLDKLMESGEYFEFISLGG